MHSRRPLPALSLVMPHPQLPSRSSLSHLPAHSPHTPRACTPSTPALFSKQLVASPRTSIDSWNSSNGAGQEDVQWEWKPEQISLLVRTLDALPGHLYTPFNGPVPPSNLLDKIARSVSQAQGPLDWPHSIRATRAKLVEIARARDKDRNKENMTIDEQDEEEVVEAPSNRSKRPLYRQSSMDFLPSRDKGNGSLSRLSSRLQRTDRIIPSYHPYARPASRSPSPPARSPRSACETDSYFPILTVFSPSVPQRTLRPRTSTNSLGSRPPVVLRRSVSTLSTHSNPAPSSAIPGTTTTSGVLPPIKSTPVARIAPMRRADSFSCAPTHPHTLKRAPSFGASSIASGAIPSKPQPAVVEKQSQDPESDDEEKARQKNVKRLRTRSISAAAPEKKKKQGSKDATTKTVPSSKTSNSNKQPSSKAGKMQSQARTRSGSMFGAELPRPQPNNELPAVSESRSTRGVSPPPASTPRTKTLRRVKTTTFNLGLGPCPMARRISFGSLAAPLEEQLSAPRPEPETGANALGSAFELS